MLRGRGAVPGGDAAPRPRLPAGADELAARLGSVSLGSTAAPDAPAAGSAMDVDTDSDSDSDDSTRILAVDPPAPSPEAREQAMAQRAAAVASPQETLKLRIDAQVQQTFAQRREHLLPAAPFDGLLEANDDNKGTGFAPLRQAAWDCVDAARAWREVADHHAVVLAAAQRFGLADVCSTASRAAEFCEAAAARADMRGQLLKALAAHWPAAHDTDEGNFRWLETAAADLRAVMEHGRTQGLQWSPGDGFDLRLRKLVENASAQLERVLRVEDHRHPLVPGGFRSAPQVPEWQLRFALATLDLRDAVGSLCAAQAQGQPVEPLEGDGIAPVRGRLGRLAEGLQADLLAADVAAGSGDLRVLQATARGLARRAGQFQALVQDAPVLQRLGRPEADPAALARPFAVLQQACQAVAGAAGRFGTEEAAALQQAAAAAHAAAAVPSGLAAESMGALASFCTRLSQDVLSAQAAIEQEAAKEFLWQAGQATVPAGHRLETLMSGLPALLSGDPQAAARLHATQDGDRAAIGQMMALAHEAEARLAAPTLPDGAPPQALATQRATRLALQATSVAARAVAESLAVCCQALQELSRAPLRRRPALAEALAERVRRAGAAVSETLAEQIGFGSAGLSGEPARVVQGQGAKLRHTERLAERIRMPLQALGLMFEAQQEAEAFRTTASTLPPSQVMARIGQVARQCTQADAMLKAGMQRIVKQIQDEKAAGGPSAPLDAEALAVMQAFNDLRFRATTGRDLAHGRVLVDLLRRSLADPERVRSLGRTGLSQLLDQVQQHVERTGGEIERALRVPARAQSTRPLQEVVEALRGELRECRAQLASVALAGQAGASGSRGSRRR